MKLTDFRIKKEERNIQSILNYIDLKGFEVSYPLSSIIEDIFLGLSINVTLVFDPEGKLIEWRNLLSLLTIRDFMEDKIPFKSSVDCFEGLDGKKFSEMEGYYQRKIREFKISVTSIYVSRELTKGEIERLIV